ncbi:hypothetical protein ACFV1B_04660 [Streptomyces sp. NPDC059637]|uniref:hypothetical protein n=1 Tax=Streptomyces sp. NPDC059637 TaxID=3347752 RepID=UPI0036810988
MHWIERDQPLAGQEPEIQEVGGARKPKELAPLLKPTAQPPFPNPFLTYHPVGETFVTRQNEINWCPWDGRLAFFVLYADYGARSAGVWLYDMAQKDYKCASSLEELPLDTWIQVEDWGQYLWPLKILRTASGIVSAVWLDDC